MPPRALALSQANCSRFPLTLQAILFVSAGGGNKPGYIVMSPLLSHVSCDVYALDAYTSAFTNRTFQVRISRDSPDNQGVRRDAYPKTFLRRQSCVRITNVPQASKRTRTLRKCLFGFRKKKSTHKPLPCSPTRSPVLFLPCMTEQKHASTHFMGFDEIPPCFYFAAAYDRVWGNQKRDFTDEPFRQETSHALPCERGHVTLWDNMGLFLLQQGWGSATGLAVALQLGL